MNYVPFVYLLKFLPTGQFYYGSRTAKNCQTSDLWTEYFTSSKIVKGLIEEHGKESFEFEIRKTFETKAEALGWETRFLTRVNAKRNPLFLNKSNGGKNFIGRKWSEEERANKSAMMTGKPRAIRSPEGQANWLASVVGKPSKNRGRKKPTRTPEHSAKISLSRKGQKLPPQSKETKTKRADANRGKENKPRTVEQWAATAALRAFNRKQHKSLLFTTILPSLQ